VQAVMFNTMVIVNKRLINFFMLLILGHTL
jgi:hypothetical protein